MNLVHNFRSMGLYHMLILASERGVCEGLWAALPELACVWWPSMFKSPRPESLYHTMFGRAALAFFEARKVLLERLVVRHRLNVLHLDADSVWFANPYPLFKTLYADYQLIVQADNPWANAGILYVQNVVPGDAASWVLEELNRRIARFTYHPESVRALPHSGWSRPPHFSNADEQANLNDVLASSLGGAQTFAGGVEFAEARFKERFAPRGCFGGRSAAKAECAGVAEARRLMKDGRWHAAMNEASVAPARRALRRRSVDGASHGRLLHLCGGEARVSPGMALRAEGAPTLPASTVPENTSVK